MPVQKGVIVANGLELKVTYTIVVVVVGMLRCSLTVITRLAWPTLTGWQ